MLSRLAKLVFFGIFWGKTELTLISHIMYGDKCQLAWRNMWEK